MVAPGAVSRLVFTPYELGYKHSYSTDGHPLGIEKMVSGALVIDGHVLGLGL